MSGYRTFAVAAKSYFGVPLVERLLQSKQRGEVDTVVLLTRAGSGDNSDLAQKGVIVKSIAYEDVGNTTEALKGIDVIISTVTFGGLDNQLLLAKAAKAAGVKLFVPSEFGIDTTVSDITAMGVAGAGAAVIAKKASVREELKAIGVSHALFFCGLFIDWFFSKFEPLNLANGKVTVGVDGSGAASWTPTADAADYVVWTLVHLRSQELENKVFRFESERKTIKDVLDEYQKRTWKTLEIAYVPLSELHQKKDTDFYMWFLHYIYHGHAVVGKEDELTTALYADWEPKKVMDVLV